MNDSRPPAWNQVKAVLDEVLDKETHQRLPLVEELCQNDELKQQVMSVLNAYESVTEAFDDSGARRRAGRLDSLTPERFGSEAYDIGSRIGPYQLEEKIGSGGMGTVFVARRADRSYDKKVAIKLLKRRWASEDEIGRFRRERQILANLSHPAIAQLLDGGSTEDGHPYLVLEYVEGLPIDTYCQKNNLNLEQRLSLFLQVCTAVQFAHRNLVVHRDLKPGNILVDDEGQVKLLDFGIAKILDAEDFAMTVLETRPGSSPMTLAYAAPEQIQGQPVTTATDVYSLGILLYELLTGRRPYKLDGFNLPEAVDAICRREVTAPSVGIRRLETQPDSVAGSASVSWKNIRGDLDAIVLKALAKEPERRYASAEQMADDLNRFQTSKPVRARRDTLIYRSKKYLYRHRIGLTAAGVVLAVLLGSIAVLLMQQVQLKRQYQQAWLVTEWMQDFFRLPDPSRSLGKTITARDLLDQSEETIRQKLASDPQLQSRMLGIVGQTYLNLGLPEDARPLAGSAYQMAVRFGFKQETLDHLILLAKIAIDRRRYLEADGFIHQGLDWIQQGIGQKEQKAELLILKARTDMALNRRADSERWLLAAINEARRVEDDAILGESLLELAQFRFQQALTREALELSREAVGILSREHPAMHPLVARAERLNTQLGIGHIGADQAKEKMLEILEKEKILHKDNPSQLSTTYTFLAIAFAAGDNPREAEPYFEEAIRLAEEAWGVGHPPLAASLNNFARLKLSLGELEAAKELFQRALVLLEKEYGKKNLNYGFTLGQIGNVEYQLSRRASAEQRATHLTTAREQLLEALPVVESSVGESHHDTVEIYFILGLIHKAQGRLQDAEGWFLKAVNSSRKAPEPPIKLPDFVMNLGRIHGDLDKFDKAIDLMTEVIETATEEKLKLQAHTWKARYHLKIDQFEQAEREARLADEGWSVDKSKRAWMISNRKTLGTAILGLNRPQEALKFLNEVMASYLADRASTKRIEELQEDIDRALAMLDSERKSAAK